MGVLLRVVCVFGAFASVLVFSSQAWAKHHSSPQNNQVVAKASARHVAVKAVKGSRVAKKDGKLDKKSKSASNLVVRERKRKSGHEKLVVVMTKASRSRLSRTTLLRQSPREEVRPSDELELDRAGNPLLRSSAFFVQDVRSGRVLLERNANTVVPIASITKLMTAMVVLDARLPLNEALTISESDVDRLKGTSSRLAVGTRMSREDFMRLALMSSENRAASALSHNYPGGLSAFVAAMNAKARSLGMSDTRFYDGSGLNHNNVSSARDLASLVSNASHYPLIREFTTTAEHAVELLDGRVHTFHNTNGLVKSPEWQIEVSKTGFINESGKCLVMQAWLVNKPLAIVLLDSAGRFTRQADANRIRRWLEEVLPRNAAKVAGVQAAGKSLN